MQKKSILSTAQLFSANIVAKILDIAVLAFYTRYSTKKMKQQLKTLGYID